MSAETPVRVEKLMSLSLAEFQRSITPLAGGPLPPDRTSVELPAGSGKVLISYDPRPSVRYGGLLDLPRAVVSLTFTGVAEPSQRAFLERFDSVFRRGGG